MNRLQVSLLTALTMLLGFRPEPLAAQRGGAPVVCNDGQIPVSVARAFKDMQAFTKDWTVQGWYTVSPGQCSAIGPEHTYTVAGIGLWSDEDYSVTLLAFAFTDSTGAWGAASARATEEGGEHYGFKPSNQQLCVQNGAFVYTRNTSKGEPAKACDGLAGYYRIPASLAFYGQSDQPLFADPLRAPAHVSLGPTDRAIPLGTHGPSQAPSNAPAAKQDYAADPPPPSDAFISWTAENSAMLLQGVREDVADYIQASKSGFETYKSGKDYQVAAGYRTWESRVKPLLATGCWVVQGSTSSTFSCLLYVGSDLDGMRWFFNKVTDDVTASLPGDWSADATPPFGPEYPASKGYRSSSGAHGEVWIANAQIGGGYEVHFQLISAPSQPTANPPHTNP